MNESVKLEEARAQLRARFGNIKHVSGAPKVGLKPIAAKHKVTYDKVLNTIPNRKSILEYNLSTVIIKDDDTTIEMNKPKNMMLAQNFHALIVQGDIQIGKVKADDGINQKLEELKSKLPKNFDLEAEQSELINEKNVDSLD